MRWRDRVFHIVTGSLERWLYNGLHSLDFGYLYKRPLWDIVMLVLLVGGLTSSTIGLCLGFKRVVRVVAGSVPDRAHAMAQGISTPSR